MITTKRTNSVNNDFQTLVKELDADLKTRDGEEHDFYHQFNKTDMIQHTVVAYDGDQAIGCGAVKEYSPETMEVGYKKCVLETGKKQPEAIELYKKNRYKIVPNYGQYENVENSVCFEKELTN